MNEVPLFPWWLALAFAIWAAVGPLVGLVAGHFLARPWQKKQWRLDNETQEYRELLDALSGAYLSLAKTELLPGTDRVKSTPEPSETEDAAYRLLNDRIFIASKLRGENVLEQWTTACKRFAVGQDTFTEFSNKYTIIQNTIIRLATGSAIDEGDASGVARGNPFERVRKRLKLSQTRR